MNELSCAVQNLFGVDDLTAFRMSALNLMDNKIRAVSDKEIELLNKWVGGVFAIVEHERRRRKA